MVQLKGGGKSIPSSPQVDLCQGTTSSSAIGTVLAFEQNTAQMRHHIGLSVANT